MCLQLIHFYNCRRTLPVQLAASTMPPQCPAGPPNVARDATVGRAPIFFFLRMVTANAGKIGVAGFPLGPQTPTPPDNETPFRTTDSHHQHIFTIGAGPQRATSTWMYKKKLALGPSCGHTSLDGTGHVSYYT